MILKFRFKCGNGWEWIWLNVFEVGVCSFVVECRSREGWYEGEVCSFDWL